MHPDDAEQLLTGIRELTDAPIRWVINSQFHGDHYMGNSVFAREGATIIAHRDTLPVMLERFEYEVSVRPFEQRGQRREDVTLVPPDLLFDHRMTLELGNYVVELIYLGAGQNEGDTLIYFPHADALHTGGVFHNRSWANTSYTPSLAGWINVLRAIRTIDASIFLPPHGQVANSQDLEEFTNFISTLNEVITASVAQDITLEQMLDTHLFSDYSDWRGYDRRERNLTALYQLVTSGQAQYFVPSDRAQPPTQ